MTESEILIRLADFDWSRAQKKDFIDILNSISNDAARETEKLSQKITTLETALGTANGKISTLESTVSTLQEAVKKLQEHPWYG
jgi:polyhydroxyalkanoate synthesis regulator phasin